MLQKLLERIPLISKQKLEILMANNGKEAVDIFESHQFNIFNSMTNRIKVIFMDCEMPIMNGYDASINIREIEAKNKNFQECMIIGVSGNEGDAHVR